MPFNTNIHTRTVVHVHLVSVGLAQAHPMQLWCLSSPNSWKCGFDQWDCSYWACYHGYTWHHIYVWACWSV